MRIPVQNIDDWIPKPKQPESKQPVVGTGELRIAPSREYKPALDQFRVVMETPAILSGPGMLLGVLDKQSRLAEYRALADAPLKAGITFDAKGQPQITDVPHPASTAEAPVKWDPFTYMPRFVFEVGEDAPPVSPSFDGDADVNNDAPQEANGEGGSYKDGVIGKNQALSGGFAVTQKGEYTVLTYSFYYATNKAGHYHGKDWSHAQVYLKPDATGELKPEYVYTSWHHGGILTPWDDVSKDAQGKPVLEVQLGSHAVAPLGKDMAIPTKGLQIQGDGKATLDGKPIDHALTWESFQSNVQNATPLEAGTDAFTARMLTMRYGKIAFDPIMPEVFLAHAGFGKAVKEKAQPVLESVKATAKAVIDGLKAGAQQLYRAVFN